MASEKCAPFRCMLALAGLLALLGVVVEVCLAQEHSDPNYHFYLRPRLGHFGATEEFRDAYEEYFENVIKHDDRSLKTINVNDWRRGRPTGKQCVVFLQDFQVRNYKLSKPFDVIVLDACLDWILADSKEADSEKKLDYDLLDNESKGEADELAADQKLKDIYTSTQFGSSPDTDISHEVQQKLHAYLARLLKINADNPKNWCHSLWMEAYNDFIEELYLSDCEHPSEGCKFYGIAGSESDSYLKMIAESTTSNLKTCYNVVQKQMVSIMRKDYDEKSGLNLFVTSTAAKQAKRMRWGQEMVKILQIASGTSSKDPIQLSDVVIDLNNIRYEDEETIERFTGALGKFALSNVNLKESQDDEKGLKRYRKAMTKLCLPYINPKEFFKTAKTIDLGEQDSSKKPFEFYNLIYNLIRMTNHEQLIGISKSKFEEDVLQRGWVPLYLATFACQIISTTWGTIDYTENEDAFAVSLRPNAQVLIEDWPLDVLVERLADAEPGPNDEEDFEEDEEVDNEQEIIYRKVEANTTKKPKERKTVTSTTKKPNSKIKPRPTQAPKNLPQPVAPLEHNNQEEQVSRESKSNSVYKGFKKLIPKWSSSNDRKSRNNQQPQPPQQPIQQIINQVVNIPHGSSPVIKQYAHQSNGGAFSTDDSQQMVGQQVEMEEPKKMMSLKTIMMFYDLQGRLPRLEPAYFELYPELLDLRQGKGPSKPAQKPQPQPPAPYTMPQARFDAPEPKYNNYEPSSFNSAPESRLGQPQEQRYQSQPQYRNSEFLYNTNPSAFNDQRGGYGGLNEPQPMMRQYDMMEPGYMSKHETSYVKPDLGFGANQQQEFNYNRGPHNQMGRPSAYGFEGPAGGDFGQARGTQAGSNKATSLFF